MEPELEKELGNRCASYVCKVNIYLCIDKMINRDYSYFHTWLGDLFNPPPQITGRGIIEL